MTSPFGWRPNRPYNELPRLPPAVELETRPVLKQCVHLKLMTLLTRDSNVFQQYR